MSTKTSWTSRVIFWVTCFLWPLWRLLGYATWRDNPFPSKQIFQYFLAKTVKGFLLYTHANQLIFHSFTAVTDVDNSKLLSNRQRISPPTASNTSRQNGSIYIDFWSPIFMSDMKRTNMMWAHTVGCITGKEPGLKGTPLLPWSVSLSAFDLGWATVLSVFFNKEAIPLFCRWTPSPPRPSAAKYLKRTAQSKGRWHHETTKYSPDSNEALQACAPIRSAVLTQISETVHFLVVRFL